MVEVDGVAGAGIVRERPDWEMNDWSDCGCVESGWLPHK